MTCGSAHIPNHCPRLTTGKLGRTGVIHRPLTTRLRLLLTRLLTRLLLLQVPLLLRRDRDDVTPLIEDHYELDALLMMLLAT